MREFNVERHARDVRVTHIYEGTSQLQLVAAIGPLLAGAFVRECIDRRVILALPDVVFIETMNLLNRRQGPRVAIEVGTALRHNPLYQWQALGPDDERATWALFQKYDDKPWSYTDCAVLALAKSLRIAEVFTFDPDFDQMPGIVRVPR